MNLRLDVLSQVQRKKLKEVFSQIPNPRSFTVVGQDGGDIRNPNAPEMKWSGSWSNQEKISAMLTLDEAIDLLDKTPSVQRIALCFYPNCGHAAVDLDDTSQDLSTVSVEQRKVIELLNQAPSEISKSATGLHIFFLADARTTKDNGHIELFGDWGYVCLTGNFTEGVTTLPTLDPEIVLELQSIIKPPKEKLISSIPQSNETNSLHEPQEILDLLYNCDPNVPYDRWMNLCFAFQTCYTKNDAFDQFDHFSQRGITYDPVVVQKIWNSYDHTRSNHTIGTLIHEAREYKGLPVTVASNQKIIGSTLNDAGNARRFADQMRDKYLYVPEIKTWLRWESNYWQYDNSGSVKIAAMQVAKSIFHEAAQVDSDIARKISQWANASLQKNHLDAMVELAKPFLSVSLLELDADPMLLGVRNGLIDLRTGIFRKAMPSDLITQQCDVNYDSTAIAPIWGKFMLEVANNDIDLVKYKQESWGYTLTGETSEQCFFYYHGGGRNGKSTEINLMHAVMGSYAKSIPSSVLMVKNNYGNQGPTPEIARLVGARLVIANETEDGARLAESQIKAMTGQDILTARVLQGNPFEFKPKFKLFISGNHKPVIRGEDDGIWRRIKVIPFTHQIPESDVDPKLYDKLMAERSGILNWMIEGCLAWQNKGKLLEPPVIRSEVSQYRSDQDIMGAWLSERCVLSPDKQCGTRELYLDYADWVKNSGSTPVAETRFATRLTEKGFIKDRVKQKMTFFGLDLIRGHR